MSKVLVAFYSRANENYVNGQIKNLKVGNTEIAANKIANLTNADMFKIEQVNPYSDNYNECISQAQDDQRKNARPELKKYHERIDEYDVIYLGYPNYWSTMPMAVFTFLVHFNFDGKIIRPFCTHEGSGLGNSISDIKKLCPGATVEEGLAIQGCRVEQAQEKIKKWLNL